MAASAAWAGPFIANCPCLYLKGGERAPREDELRIHQAAATSAAKLFILRHLPIHRPARPEGKPPKAWRPALNAPPQTPYWWVPTGCPMYLLLYPPLSSPLGIPSVRTRALALPCPTLLPHPTPPTVYFISRMSHISIILNMSYHLPPSSLLSLPALHLYHAMPLLLFVPSGERRGRPPQLPSSGFNILPPNYSL